jgi:hypothetical protein
MRTVSNPGTPVVWRASGRLCDSVLFITVEQYSAFPSKRSSISRQSWSEFAAEGTRLAATIRTEHNVYGREQRQGSRGYGKQ